MDKFIEFINHAIVWGSITLFSTFVVGLLSVMITHKLETSAKYRDFICCSSVILTVISSSIWYWS